MIRLTLFLCAGLFLLLLIGGEDRGQLRPGLARAAAEREAEPAPAPVVIAAAEDAAPAPVVLAVAPAPAASPDPAPVAVEPALPATAVANAAADVAGDVPVFTLSSFADGAVLAPAEEAAAPDPVADVQVFYITGRSVNVREGPGTENPVLARLTRGEAVGVVWTDDTGWARVRIEGDGIEGYVSTDFLSPSAP